MPLQGKEVNFVDILFNAAGGGVLGSLLHCVTDYFDTKNKVMLMNAQVAVAEKTEAWKAFAASQTGSESLQIPEGTPAWVSSLYLTVDAFKQLTRPLLTWVAFGVIVYVYSTSTPLGREQLQSEITFGSFTAIFWYFGARYSRQQK